MRREDLQYDLPEELIAQAPAARRDESRLLVLRRSEGMLAHARFRDLPGLLPPGALLVFNDTRVLPARLRLQRSSGGLLEGLFLREVEPGLWSLMMTGAGRVKAGESLRILPPEPSTGPFHEADQRIVLVERVEGGTWQVRPEPGGAAVTILESWGAPPLPPYILKQRSSTAGDPRHPGDSDGTVAGGSSAAAADRERYQTVYARQPGAVAAPTAGLHFTPELLTGLRGLGFDTAFVTLHVGAGTFAPVRAADLRDHDMHSEWYDLSEEVASRIRTARAQRRAVIAVGTTSVRVLETCASADPARAVEAGSGWTRIFIYPPYAFRAIDGMITNFHLPESTLLAMAFAFAGRDRVLAAYDEAIRERYRFYSYGDAMLIL